MVKLGKGTSGALASAVKKTKKEYEKTIKLVEKETNLKVKYDNQLKRPPGRRPNFEKTIVFAEKQRNQAKYAFEKAIENQAIAKRRCVMKKLQLGKIIILIIQKQVLNKTLKRYQNL